MVNWGWMGASLWAVGCVGGERGGGECGEGETEGKGKERRGRKVAFA